MQFEFTLSSAHQKALALILTFLPCFGLFAGLWIFVTDQIDRHAEASLLIRELTRAREILARAPAQHQKLEQLKSSAEWQGLFAPRSPGTPVGTVSTVVKTYGGKVQTDSMERLNSSGAAEVDEHIVFTANTEQLAHILVATRGRRPLFVIRALSIRSSEALPNQGQSSPLPLTVDLTVAEFEHP
jgi:hypothetical protein